MRAPLQRLLPPALLLVALLTAGAAPKPIVFVTIPPQRWLVQTLAGDAVQVELMVAPGQDPHTFEPSGRQMARLARAQGWLTIGLPFEGTLLAKARGACPDLKSFAVDQGIPRLGGHAHAGHDHSAAAEKHETCGAVHDGTDPHIWLAPRGMLQMATNTCRVLQSLLPAEEARLAAALAELTDKLIQLERELTGTLAPVAGKTFWVYHLSWAYFAKAFGLHQQAVEQDGREPSARQLARLIESARADRVRVLFTDPHSNPGPVRTLARHLDARVATLDPLAEVWPDNLRHVATAIRGALQEPSDEPDN